MTAGAIIVSAALGAADQAWFDQLRRAHFPPERNHLAAHLTMFHALPGSIEAEVKGRVADLVRQAPPRATIAGVISLGRGVAYRIDSHELGAMREALADAFSPLLTPQDRAGWSPHITVQNKVDPAIARDLKAALEATFSPGPLTISGIDLSWYRGGPWELIRRYPFRGVSR